MKKILLLISIVMLSEVLSAQLNVMGSVAGGYNMANNLGAFKDIYNETNSEDLKNKLGGMNICKGYGLELNYRILGLSTTVSRTYLHTGTMAKFNNGAKRIMDFNYKFTNALVGAGFNLGENSEMRIEVGMVHSVSDLYSYVKYATGEVDYHAGGASHQSTHTNIGLAARIAYTKKISERWLIFGSALFNRINAEDIEIAPSLEYMGTHVTHTYSGVSIHVGLGYQLLEKLD